MKRILRRGCCVLITVLLLVTMCTYVFASGSHDVRTKTFTAQTLTEGTEIMEPQPRGYATVNGNGVRVRSKASTSGTIKGLLYKGDRVFVYKSYTTSDGIWCDIERLSDGLTGFVKRDYLTY